MKYFVILDKGKKNCHVIVAEDKTSAENWTRREHIYDFKTFELTEDRYRNEGWLVSGEPCFEVDWNSI